MNEDLSNLNLVDLIDLLEPVPEPVPVPLWPQTAGWFWLALLVVGLLVLAAHWLLRRHRANAYRRAALRELEAANGNATAIARILRRTAIAAYGRQRVAALSGDAWLGFLDTAVGGSDFCSGPGRALAIAPYQKDANTDGLTDLAAAWIRGHRTGG